MSKEEYPRVMVPCPGCGLVKTANVHEEFACRSCGWGIVVIKDKRIQGVYYVAGVSPDAKSISMVAHQGFVGLDHILLRRPPFT